MFFLFFGGLLVGSFLNVVISRLETGESFVSGRSRCDSCREIISWYDNIPLLSFLLLRGKCRTCGQRISWQHPAVEFSTAMLFAVTGWALPDPVDVSSAIGMTLVLGLVAALTVVFVFDLIHMEIPVSVLVFSGLWTAASLVLLRCFAPSGEAFADSRLAEGLIGGAIAFALFYALVFFSKETWMGEGDAWLALVLGLSLGWKLLLPALTLAFGSGALVGIGLMLFGKKGMESPIPFGPFLAASVIFMSFFGTMVGRVFGFFMT